MRTPASNGSIIPADRTSARIVLAIMGVCGVGGCLLLCVMFGMKSINRGRTYAHEAQTIVALPAQSSATVDQLSIGAPVLLIGEIEAIEDRSSLDPATNDGYPDLLIYGIEAYNRVQYRRSNSKRSYYVNEWVQQGQFRPIFRLWNAGQSVDIRNTLHDYRMWNPPFTSPSTPTLGTRRYSGFNRGDTVLMYGTRSATGVEAKIVSSGTAAGFAAQHQSIADYHTRYGIGIIGLGVLVLGIVCCGLGLLYRRSRAAARKISQGLKDEPPRMPHSRAQRRRRR